MIANHKNDLTQNIEHTRNKIYLRQIRQNPDSNLPLAEALCPDLGGRAHPCPVKFRRSIYLGYPITRGELQGFWSPFSD